MATSLKHRAAGVVHRIPTLGQAVYRIAYGPIGTYLAHAWPIPGWLGRHEGLALGRLCYELPDAAVVVEIGSFLGKSAVVLAGARKLRGSGMVHCVDPFDASGDAFSVPVYQSIANRMGLSLRERFDAHLAQAGVTDWVRVHQGTAASVSVCWKEPVDLLFLDGDQSPDGARLAYDLWSPHLKVGGIIFLHNSIERDYHPSHGGHHLVVLEKIRQPEYGDIRSVETSTIARRLNAPQ